MPKNPIANPLPADLPENWLNTQTIAAAGADVGLSEKHGYNYLMEQVNAVQRAANAIGAAFAGLTPAGLGAVPETRKVNGFPLSSDIKLTPKDIPGSAKATCVVVGTSTATGTTENCDYLCDGVSDNVEISAAIEDAYSRNIGIYFLAGTYNLSGSIKFRQGMQVYGSPTTSKGGYMLYGTPLNTLSSSVKVEMEENCELHNIIFRGVGKIQNCNFFSCLLDISYRSHDAHEGAYGSRFYGCNVSGDSMEYCTMIGCICKYITNSKGLLILGGPSVAENNSPYLFLSDSENCAIVGAYYATDIATTIELYNSKNNIVALNTCVFREKSLAVSLEGVKLTGSSNNLIIGNTVIGADPAIDKTIFLSGNGNNNNLILGNMIWGKNYVSEGGTGNTFVNNKYN